ncbi:MAG: hypothetical protein IJ475_03115 [Bacilli bacterium]|nr:hypothetical protein [Bacilli bacterium]
MMLNNHGWGLKDMIIYTCIILFFFFIACFFIGAMYRDFEEGYYDNDSDNQIVSDVLEEPIHEEEYIDYKYYYEKEFIFKSSVDVYLNELNYDVTNHIFNIRLNELVNLRYMDMIYDPITGTACDGYANVIGEGTQYEINAYILCSNYMSEGYYGG